MADVRRTSAPRRSASSRRCDSNSPRPHAAGPRDRPHPGEPVIITITRDIVLDLLPLYAAGEASADSRAAVETVAAQDATVAALLRALQDAPRLGDASETVEPPASLERTAINRTRAMIRRRAWTFGLALAFTLLPLTFAFSGGRVTFSMLREQPQSALFWIGAAFLWWQYARLTRELKGAGL